MNHPVPTGATPIATALPKRVKNLTGHIFGRLTVLDYAGRAENSRHALWWVRCSCPLQTEKKIEGYILVRGHAQSCGCLRVDEGKKNITHGMYGTPEYGAWINAKKRCTNKGHRSYARYGGRGITMSEEFINSFDVFFEHVGRRPSPWHSLDRLNNELGYVRGNLAWRTSKEQQRNRSVTKLISYNGENLTAGAWGERLGLTACSIWVRIRALGWSIEKAVTTPSFRRNKKPTREFFFEWV